MKNNFLIAIMMCMFSFIHAQQPRDILTHAITPEELNNSLIPLGQWHPFPKIEDRKQWDSLHDSIRLAYIRNAEQYLGKSWDVMPATTFLDFQRNGNRKRYEDINFARRKRLTSLVFAEAVENKGRFLDDIANGIWTTCEETFWGLPAHIGDQKLKGGLPDIKEPIVDLFAAETGAMLAWTMYVMGDKIREVSPVIADRVLYEENRRIITPYMENNDYEWMGFTRQKIVNNWNPWINSNVLSVVLLLEKNEQRRNQAVTRIMKSLDVFMNCYPEDGGCDEGPTYWSKAGASLFDALELLYSATNGKINAYENPLIQNIGQYIYKVWIDGNYYINFADASALNYPEPAMVYRFGKRIHDPLMIGFGVYLARQQKLEQKLILPEFASAVRVLPDLFAINSLLTEKPLSPYTADFWFPKLQVMGGRSDTRSAAGFYICAKGGHNNESHNHNDVGNFIVYCDGKPVLIDAGVETYTAKTFGPHRYELWTMQSSYHNLPEINGVQQAPGTKYKAEDLRFSASKKTILFSLDIANAYPEKAGVASWIRTLTLNRGKNIVLNEKYQLTRCESPLKTYLMTPLKVDVPEPGKVKLISSSDHSAFEIHYDRSKFSASFEDMLISDPRLMNVWGNHLTRIIFTSLNNNLTDKYSMIITKE